MTVDRKEVITIPKWLIIVAVPVVVSIFTAGVTSAVTSAKYEVKIATLEKEIELKSNSAEVNLQFQFIAKQLQTINDKLDVSETKLDRNEQTTLGK